MKIKKYAKYIILIMVLLAIVILYHTHFSYQDTNKIIINSKLADICDLRKISDQKYGEAIDLLNSGADPDQKEKYESSLVKLMTSWELYNDKNTKKLFMTLLDHGADPNGVILGETDPLILWGFDKEMNQCLIKHGASLEAKTIYGDTVENILLKQGNTNVLNLFKYKNK